MLQATSALPRLRYLSKTKGGQNHPLPPYSTFPSGFTDSPLRDPRSKAVLHQQHNYTCHRSALQSNVLILSCLPLYQYANCSSRLQGYFIFSLENVELKVLYALMVIIILTPRLKEKTNIVEVQKARKADLDIWPVQ